MFLSDDRARSGVLSSTETYHDQGQICVCSLDYFHISNKIMPLELWPADCSDAFLLRVKRVCPWVFDAGYHSPSSPQYARERFVDVVEIGAAAIARATTEEGLRAAHVWSQNTLQSESILLDAGQDLCDCVAFWSSRVRVAKGSG